MSDASGRYWLVLNGEIYNYRELRAEIAAQCHVFRTQSDTEVLLAALIQWGEGALPRLAGMFAFALWDDQSKTLLVVRDRFGIKPVYQAQTAHGVAFASEIKQLHDLPGVSRAMNLRRVREFLGTGILDHSADTLFAGVGQLRGGQLTRLDCSRMPDTALAVRTWYRLPKPGSLSLSLPAAAETFRNLFEESIRLHLRSDVPLGACLSGGLDSSSIVGVASRQLGRAAAMTTVSAVFDHARIDERRFMDAVIARTGCTARFVSVEPKGIFEMAGDTIWQHDEPFGSTSILAQMSVFADARAAGLKVMLDGQGADELLSGYHTMFGPALAGLIRARQPVSAFNQVLDRQRIHNAGIGGQLVRALPYLLSPSVRAQALSWRRRAGGADWLDGDALRPLKHCPSPFEAANHDLGTPGAVDLGTFAAAQTMSTSLPMLLHWEDRSSMAHGIEARVPFLDHRLAEFAIALGQSHKIEGARTKVLLREALGGDLPDAVRNRTDKLGFATPEQEWFLGPLKEPVRAAVLRTLDRYPQLLDRPATIAWTDEMLSGRRAFDFSLWRIASVGIWGERFGLKI